MSVWGSGVWGAFLWSGPPIEGSGGGLLGGSLGLRVPGQLSLPGGGRLDGSMLLGTGGAVVTGGRSSFALTGAMSVVAPAIVAGAAAGVLGGSCMLEPIIEGSAAGGSAGGLVLALGGRSGRRSGSARVGQGVSGARGTVRA